jgi:gamma-glutamyltranspeptidase/glutathione hydrolase
VLALNGSKSFYSGEIAKGIVNTVQNKNNNPGVLSLSDLNNYKVKEREAICSKYRGFDICGMGPPSSGALSVGIILGILENFDLRSLGPKSAEAWRLIGDASRLSFADRGRYMADSDFVFVPVKALLNKDYLGARAKLLQTGRALEYVHPGVPSYNLTNFYADDQSIELPSTSHISIVDSYGNALAMTTTIENAFGSRLMTPGGFLLNNELTDFSFKTNIDGVPIANRVEPVKRPRSSMSPTIVLKDNKPVLVLGSTGGSGIIGFVVKTIIAHIDWGMDVKAAIDFPNLINRFGTFDIEMGAGLEKLADQLIELGFVVKIRPLNSGTHAISLSAAGLHGAADYRREGIALGF